MSAHLQGEGKQPHDHLDRCRKASDKNSTSFHDKNTKQTQNRTAFSASGAGTIGYLYAKIINWNRQFATHTKFMMCDYISIKLENAN